MAGNVIKANKPYEIERLEGDRTAIHFKPQMLQESKDIGKARLLFWAAVLGGWFPGVAAVAENDGHPVMILIVWALCIAVGVIAMTKAYKSQTKRGSDFTTVMLGRDTLETAGDRSVLARDDIEGFIIQSADTRFTFRDRTEYRMKKARSDNKAENGFSILAEYGDQKIMVIEQCLNERQADKLAGELEKWRRDPSHLVGPQAAADAA
jgi:hypothetical protein